jgi:molybdate transport system regulatory protein
MTTSKKRRRPAAVPLTPRVKVWLELDGCYVFGLGISEILGAVDETGSIKRAAAALGKSYRYTWGRLKEAERTLGQPLVQTQVGGLGDQRSTLTPVAHKYTKAFLAMRRRLSEVVEHEFEHHFRAD